MNRELDSTDPLLYLFESTVDEYVTYLKACVEDIFCTRISYNFKKKCVQVAYKLDDLGEPHYYRIHKEICGRKEYSECSSDIFSSDNAYR